jgi:plasmid stability protein
MTAQSLTLRIPSPLYDRLKQRAAASDRSVEEETLDLLASAVPAGEALPDDLAAAVAELDHADDQTLLQAARSHLSPQAAAELESLHFKQQQGTLTDAEREAMRRLVLEYERAMLVRARAAALLHQRGLEVPTPGAP